MSTELILQNRIQALELAVSQREYELRRANLVIESLREQLRLERVKFLGPKSETLSDLQLQLLIEEEPSVTLDEVEAESERELLEALPEPAKKRRRPHPGRQPMPGHLPRVEEVIAAPAGPCKRCGGAMATIGYDESELLDAEPKKYFVRVIKREKKACPCCKRGPVAMTQLAPRIVEKGMASDRVVIDTVVAKYCQHLPLYRQEAMWKSEAGVELGRATLDGWVMRVGELAQTIVAQMRLDLLSGDYIQADETTMPVQVRGEKKGANHQAYLWQYGRPGGETVFDFVMSRERAGPVKFLGDWAGKLQTDGYQAYEGVGGAGIVHAGCFAHARRYFVDAVKVNKQDGEAIKMVTRMDALFAVERNARERHLTVDERAELRREHAMGWVDEIHAECEKLRPQVLPKSALGIAVNYTLNQWKKLKRCYEYPVVELSNNLAENSMRPVALGRKNWLHVGSAKSGPSVAAILSLVESCRRLNIPVREYLMDVLPGLAERKRTEVTTLTPGRWAARRG
jgi:transposase